MTPLQEVVSKFQELVAQVPEFIQPLIVMLAGAVPFVEGELAATIGLLGGLNPVVAGVVAAVGNFLSVLVVVLLTSRARTAVVAHNAHSRVPVGAAVGAPEHGGRSTGISAVEEAAPAKPLSKGRQRLNMWVVRFGVPGASILGPLAIPTQLTSAIFVAGGTPRRWVLLWQAVAIVLWTTVTTVSIWAALTYLVGA